MDKDTLDLFKNKMIDCFYSLDVAADLLKNYEEITIHCGEVKAALHLLRLIRRDMDENMDLLLCFKDDADLNRYSSVVSALSALDLEEREKMIDDILKKVDAIRAGEATEEDA